MDKKSRSVFEKQLQQMTQSGLKKETHVMQSPQAGYIDIGGRKVLNLCASNYLGLANHPDIVKAAISGLYERGYGVASVRSICGTQDVHQDLENRISAFFETDETLLYSSCFEANTGLFEPLLGEEDVVLYDTMNHASIIDGVRLCKAKAYRYRHNDMSDLECLLKASSENMLRLIATNGVFSMDGDMAHLAEICDLAEQYEAMVMVDDSHATGIMGDQGRGSLSHCGVMGRIDLVTSTLGKTMGGATGGLTSGRKVLIDLLRQGSRPYLFSNALPPVIVAAAIKAFELVEAADDLRARLRENTFFFREGLERMGFMVKRGTHPIIPILFTEPQQAQQMSQALFEAGIYAAAISPPVVPEGGERIRIQISALHTKAALEWALQQFEAIGRLLELIA